MQQEITIHITLKKPPIGVHYGLQKGSGHHSATIQTQCAVDSKTEALYFECPIKISKNRDVPPDFSSVFVQGPKNERFVYLDIGASAGQINTVWSRRLKIPLRDITWAMIDACWADATQTMVVHVDGMDKKGEPSCGTVKPFDGWQVV